MKKILPVLVLTLLIFQAGHSQSIEQTSKPITEIFTDFHLNINDTSGHTGFSLNRAYLGYQITPGGKFTGKILLNVGSPEDLAPGSEPRRYSFFRDASLSWSDGKLSITGGITSTKIFQFQQTFWGKRYVANTFQSLNGYGMVADIGLVVEYKFNDIVTADYTLMNGEGYSDIQLDDNLKNSFGLTITPDNHLAFRIYTDVIRDDGVWQALALAFVGFKNDRFNIGGEINYKSNTDLIKGHHVYGVSSTGGVNLSEKAEFFIRYDYTTSVTLPGDAHPWNNLEDGSLLIGGVQFILSPNVKIAFDYRGKYPYEVLSGKAGLLYVNAFFKF